MAIKVKTADQATTSTGANFADCDDLEFPASASSTYSFHFGLRIEAGAADAIWCAVSGTSPSASLLAVCNASRGPLNLHAWGVATEYKQVIRPSTTSASGTRYQTFDGIFRNGPSPGTFRLIFQSEAGAQVRILSNSFGEFNLLSSSISSSVAQIPSFIWCGAVTATGSAFAFRLPATAAAANVTAYRPTVVTSLAGAEASGQTALSVLSETGFSIGNNICIREGHLCNYRTLNNVSAGLLTVSVAIDQSFTTNAIVTNMSGLAGVSSDSVAVTAGTDNRVKTRITSGLTPSSSYFYRVTADGSEDQTVVGWFATNPPFGTPLSFSFAVGSCCSASNAEVFSRISDKNPRIFMHIGDMAYVAPASTNAVFRAMYLDNLGTNPQEDLYLHQQAIYCPDDQDFAENNGWSGSVGVSVVQSMFRENTPTSGDQGTPGWWESIEVGRMLVIKSDCRSERSITTATDDANKIMWTPAQKTWFQQRLAYAKLRELYIAWIVSNPWIDPQTASADTWGGYSVARREVANMIISAGVQRQIFIMSGDMHALAFKRSSLDYSSGGRGLVLPVCHVSAFAQTGNLKGGPYDIGPFQGGAQYGIFDFKDVGADITAVRFRGYSTSDTILLDQTFYLDVSPADEGFFGMGV